MRLLAFIAMKHLLARKRQSLVSLLGIVIGVAFFLTISSLMQGSEKDFMKRLVDNSPHITVSDEFRTPRRQPLEVLYPDGVIELRHVTPETETRGIRGFRQMLDQLQATPGLRASGVLTAQAILSYAGRDISLTLNGMVPSEIRDITTIDDHITQGSVDDLIANRDGIIIGDGTLKKNALRMGDNINLAASTGQVRSFKIVGVFRTGRTEYDETVAFVDIKRVQAMTDRSNRANSIIIKLDNPNDALAFAKSLEARIGYKSVSWQEASEDLLSTLVVRNVIMYSVVSAVLIVAAFGIYNIISTVVMEKQRDIAILKSMGFEAKDIQKIFLVQGAILGVAGLVLGLPLGCVMMTVLGQVKLRPPGVSEMVYIPLDWSLPQFVLAGSFAFLSALFASYLPARKGAAVMPVDILRGS